MDLAAPRRNEDERPALIYRNDPEVTKATAAALRAAVISAIAENTSVSNFRQLSFSPRQNILLWRACSRSRKKAEPVSRSSILRSGGTCWRTAQRGRRWRRQMERGQRSSEPVG